MALNDTYKDFKYLNELPGKKILLKGNHDYWWNSLKKLKEYLEANNFENISFLYNNSYEYEGKIIVGTRGWNLGSKEEEDKKIIDRELIRLELSIQDGIRKYEEGKEIIVCMHYPPTNNILLEESSFIKIMQKYNVTKCIYGHLHGEEGYSERVEGNIRAV